jgi:hypothetical protein
MATLVSGLSGIGEATQGLRVGKEAMGQVFFRNLALSFQFHRSPILTHILIKKDKRANPGNRQAKRCSFEGRSVLFAYMRVCSILMSVNGS